ncbi:MAG TPA: hypothetical protein PLL80_02855 [Candidatus Pacearchaeota archaeon]|nr:hypothetical protein [Candidatus Pacearchaeota archaeon]HOK94433.1 hypothetical protein [Candidatus Pacearchaeota archaeon]HPO75513.1 hypothetical protein [Candidatus Pacearchaeota archaeon]
MISSEENNLQNQSEFENKNRLHQFHWSKKSTLILVSTLLLVGIGTIIYFSFFKNTFSKENIVIQVSGPEETISGKEVSWLVNIKNQSEITVNDVVLNFEYPSGVFADDGSIKKREQKIISTIAGGEQKSESFSGIIFGTKDEIKNGKVSVTFHPENLSTLFENQASFSTRISDTSILFSMELPTKVDPDEEFSVSFSWQSSFPFPLTDLELRFSSPDGFQRTSSKTENERIEEGKNIFDIGALNEGEGGKLEIKGKLEGKANEEKLFEANFGIFDPKLYEFIPLATVKKVVKIRTSTLDAFLKVNGDPNYVALPGENLAFIINFVNNGEDVYRNLTLTVTLDSDVLDFSTLKAPGGRVEGKKITFSSDNFPDLLFLGPYSQGSVGFNVMVKDYNSSFSKENGLIKANIDFGTIEKSFQIKVSSKISLNEKVSLSLNDLPLDINNIFNNSQTGSLLEVGKDTFFAIDFHLDNKGNKLKNSKITFSLPQEVSFQNKTSPPDLNVNFDEDTRELTLSIGDIGANFSQDYFLVFKITPTTLPQELHGEVKLTGEDVWTGKNFNDITLPLQNTDALR